MKFQNNTDLMWKKEKLNIMHTWSWYNTSLVYIDKTWLGYDFEQVQVNLIMSCLHYELSTDELGELRVDLYPSY